MHQAIKHSCFLIALAITACGDNKPEKKSNQGTQDQSKATESIYDLPSKYALPFSSIQCADQRSVSSFTYSKLLTFTFQNLDASVPKKDVAVVKGQVFIHSIETACDFAIRFDVSSRFDALKATDARIDGPEKCQEAADLLIPMLKSDAKLTYEKTAIKWVSFTFNKLEELPSDAIDCVNPNIIFGNRS